MKKHFASSASSLSTFRKMPPAGCFLISMPFWPSDLRGSLAKCNSNRYVNVILLVQYPVPLSHFRKASTPLAHTTWMATPSTLFLQHEKACLHKLHPLSFAVALPNFYEASYTSHFCATALHQNNENVTKT